MRVFCWTLNHVSAEEVIKHYKYTKELLHEDTDYHVWYNNSNYIINAENFHQRCLPPDDTVKFLFEIMAQYPDYDYYMFVESDCGLLKKGLDIESVKYMQGTGIECLFGGLIETVDGDDVRKIFAKQYNNNFKYSILSNFVITKKALLTLCKYWWNYWTSYCEVNMPGVLESHGVKIGQSPFIDKAYFRCQRPTDMSNEDVKRAIEAGVYAVHPIRDVDRIKQFF